MSDSLYHITESNKLNLKKKGPKHTPCHVLEFFLWNTYVQCLDLKSYLRGV